MKCPICGKDFSDKVIKYHKARCVKPVDSKEEKAIIEVDNAVQNNTIQEEKETEEISLEDLHQQCIYNETIRAEYAPSTIKRWKAERCLKELGK